MCGLAGYYAWGEARPKPETLMALLVAQTPKGTDSSGYAYVGSDSLIRLRKETLKPSEFVPKVGIEKWTEIAKSHTAILHARNTTRGSKTDNDNSHPQVYGGWVVTHNGTLNNDEDLFHHYKVKRFAEVDSAAIPLVLAQGKDYEDSIRQLSVLGGNATMAILNQKQPERLTLCRLGKHDVFLFMDPLKRILYWSSVPTVAELMPGAVLGNIGFTMMSKMPEDRVLICEPGSDFLGTTYKVTRNPFSIPCTTVTVGGSPRNTSGASSEASSFARSTGKISKLAEGTASAVAVAYFKNTEMEYLHNRIEHAKYPKRGIPSFDDVEIGFEPWDLDRIRFWMVGNHVMDMTLPTAYGRWVLRLKEANPASDKDTRDVMTREFLPKKSQKK